MDLAIVDEGRTDHGGRANDFLRTKNVSHLGVLHHAILK